MNLCSGCAAELKATKVGPPLHMDLGHALECDSMELRSDESMCDLGHSPSKESSVQDDRRVELEHALLALRFREHVRQSLFGRNLALSLVLQR